MTIAVTGVNTGRIDINCPPWAYFHRVRNNSSSSSQVLSTMSRLVQRAAFADLVRTRRKQTYER